MGDLEKKRLLEEMDRRTTLWEGMRNDAKRRSETGTEKAIAKIDLQVAEDALKRIETRKNEIIGKTAHKILSEHPTKLFKAVPRMEKSVVKATDKKEDLKEPKKNAIR